jgi:hypothetical protein
MIEQLEYKQLHYSVIFHAKTQLTLLLSVFKHTTSVQNQ